MVVGRAVLGMLSAVLLSGASSRGQAKEAAPSSMRGTLFPAAVHFVDTYCSACHSREGKDRKHARGYAILQLDSYDDWKASAKVIVAVTDKWHLRGKIMPPPTAKAQPSDAERHEILAWIGRGSPNTADGR